MLHNNVYIILNIKKKIVEKKVNIFIKYIAYK